MAYLRKIPKYQVFTLEYAGCFALLVSKSLATTGE